jgi:hypothetical protein
MKSKIAKILVAFVLVICLILTFAMPVSAAGSPPAATKVAGTITTTVGNGTITTIGNNTKWQVPGSSIIAGDIIGTDVENDTLFMNSTGRFVGWGQQTFTGTVMGHSVTFTTFMICNGSLDLTNITGNFNGIATILSGTDGLKHLHGFIEYKLTLDPEGTWSGSYSGKIEFGK